MQETWVQFLGQEDPLEKEVATHSRILAWGKSHGQMSLGATVHGVARVRRDLVTKPPPPWHESISDKLHTLSTAPPNYLLSSFPNIDLLNKFSHLFFCKWE